MRCLEVEKAVDRRHDEPTRGSGENTVLYRVHELQRLPSPR